MRLRLRPAYSPTQLAEIYAVPHSHSAWPDHRLRVRLTAQVAVETHERGPVADLSCGDAAIATETAGGTHSLHLGDLAPGYQYHGPIEETIDEIPSVDLFICCETLEHLDDPDLVLKKIREKTRALVVSTPDGEVTPHNPQHYWGWDADGVQNLLEAAGFTPTRQVRFAMPGLRVAFLIWGCE